MRFGNGTEVLAERVCKYYTISWCSLVPDVSKQRHLTGEIVQKKEAPRCSSSIHSKPQTESDAQKWQALAMLPMACNKLMLSARTLMSLGFDGTSISMGYRF